MHNPPSAERPRLGSFLPPDDPLRTALHNEVHTRPTAEIALPALVVYVAVLNQAVPVDAEHAHMCRLPGLADLERSRMDGNFLRVGLADCTVKWERHSEFTRYSIVQAMPDHADLDAQEPDLSAALAVSAEWLRTIPGRTIVAIKLALLAGEVADPQPLVPRIRAWFGVGPVVASVVGTDGYALAASDFSLRPSGFSRMLVVAPASTSPSRVGRVAQRLLEVETYRMMALRGLPVAKELGTMLSRSEPQVAAITAQLEGKAASDQELLDALVALAAHVERAMAQHMYRFSATAAYNALVQQRILELRERPIPGTPTLGEFMRRRLSPAIATVAATGERLQSLSERVARASDLLSTRVGIATEAQNQQLLEKLTRGQEVQVRLQSTVEGLSIAAISYYVVSLLLYGAKSLKLLGLNFDPEVAVGVMVPVVLWGVWRITRYVQHKIYPA